jgi:hypothetical protein
VKVTVTIDEKIIRIVGKIKTNNGTEQGPGDLSNNGTEQEPGDLSNNGTGQGPGDLPNKGNTDPGDGPSVTDPAPGLATWEGEGTAQNPYKIKNAEDLLSLSGKKVYWDKHFIQTADIDMAGKTWTPIGTHTYDGGFTGSYDGNNFTIINLTISGSYGGYYPDDQGMFGCIHGTVKNLGLKDVNFNLIEPASDGLYRGSIKVGGVVAVNYGTIQNCYVTGTISGIGRIGGIVGQNQGKGKVEKCYSAVNITGVWDLGGVVGSNWGTTVQNCYATGNVTGIDKDFGGIGGVVGDNDAELKNCYATGKLVGGDNVGGVAGEHNTYLYMINCVALNPSVEATTDYSYPGIRRVADINSSNSITLSNNYARSGMKKINDTLGDEEGHDKKDGKSISSTEWGSSAWWANAANWYGGAWDDTVWDFSKVSATNLPFLKEMPNGAQNPVIKNQ